MPIGAYSEKQIMPQEKLVIVPDGISNEIASCIVLKELQQNTYFIEVMQ